MTVKNEKTLPFASKEANERKKGTTGDVSSLLRGAVVQVCVSLKPETLFYDLLWFSGGYFYVRDYYCVFSDFPPASSRSK